MMWLIWRQHRLEILFLAGGAVFIAAALMYGAELALRLRSEIGADTCRPGPFTNADCVRLAQAAGERLQPFRWLLIALVFVPAVVGSFVGGPLFARDLEHGTHRLVWTQGITRLRWGATNLAAILVVAAVAAAVVGSAGAAALPIVGDWWTPSASQTSTSPYLAFNYQAPAVVAHVVFAIAVAAFVGALSRRILTGMFVGLLLFAGVQIGVQLWLRPSYEPPVTVIFGTEAETSGFQVPEGAWSLGSDHIDAEGRPVPQQRVFDAISQFRPSPGPFDITGHLAANGIYQRVRYQPADRYWRFQWTEAALFLAVSGALSAATLLLLARRDA